jgi:hypothetical protein
MAAIADHTMPEATPQLERSLEVLERLCHPGPAPSNGEHLGWPTPPGLPQQTKTIFSDETEMSLVQLRAGLANLARSLPVVSGPSTLEASLDGADYLARSEILCGKADRLPQLLPELVFFVALHSSGEAEAQRVAKRTALLVGGPESTT